MVPLKSFNVVEVFVGARGFGKTTCATARARDLQAKTGCYVIAHDPGDRISGFVPSGARPKLHRHRTVEECRASLRTNPGGFHLVSTMTAEPVLRFALELGRFVKSRAVGGRAPPVLAWVNETSSCLSAGAARTGTGRAGREEAELFDTDPVGFLASQGRHEHVGLFFEAQSARMLSYVLLENVTAVTAVRVLSLPARRRLEDVAGMPPEMVDRLPDLPVHHSVRWEP